LVTATSSARRNSGAADSGRTPTAEAVRADYRRSWRVRAPELVGGRIQPLGMPRASGRLVIQLQHHAQAAAGIR